MTSVIKVSKVGEDVLTATDPNDFILDSDTNTFKILTSGTTGGSVTSDPTLFSVAHGVAGVPTFYAFAKFPDGYVTLPNGKERASAYPAQRYWTCEVDGTYAYFQMYKGTSANYGATVSYYIFETTI